jgi:hypothetical protein
MSMRTLSRALLAGLLAGLVHRGAHAQELADYDYENLTFRGIGFDYGYIWPSKVQPAPMYSMRLDLGFLGPAVRISPSISYWSSKFRTSQLDMLADRLEALPPLIDRGVEISAADLGEIRWSDFVISLDAHVVWTAPLNVITYLGAGAAVHALNGRGDAIDDTFVEDLLDSTAAGFNVIAGAELQPFERMRIYGEGRYSIGSDIRYPALRIGASLMLPSRSPTTTPQGER